MIRPALELAWAVAKLGEQARPVVAPPGRLRPLMRFARLPDRALATVRQVVEEDDEFRARVLEVADEGGLERTAWLWLARPEGWDEDLAVLTDAAGAAALQVEAEKEERSALRRLGVAEAAVGRAEAEVARYREINTELVAEIAAERQTRRRTEAERDDIGSARRSAEAQLAILNETVVEMEARISALVADADESGQRLSTMRHERDIALAEVEVLRARLDEADAEMARATESQEEARVDIGLAVARAAAAARQLGESLADVARLVTSDSAEDPRHPVSAPPKRSSKATETGLAIRPVRHALPPDRRRPASLPPAVFDDSFEAAEHLMRLAGMLLVVDGYNVTISSWPHLELPRQRQRLVDALAELAIRTGTSVDVVFDGVDAGGRIRPPAAARHRVRVTFSPEGVDADDVIIDLVDRLDPSQPVVVATDDRRVRDDVARRGGNVISVPQLLAVLGRMPGGPNGRGSVAR